ncbi:hypothetical protein JRQ81_003458 [Phrynocephalus forsythii]|uniref:Uncharacterized protein n=1 Tax=Phrynocephalus forsythii TaxID=171643 RepID=A0A9Q1AX82_9SAUR|nr:hypothetical protein JRQ81_003458 [Phrynocephalus forsythii]
MAAASPAADPVQSLEEEVTCALCLEEFVGCGHIFCRPCLTRCWGGTLRDVSCPLCRATFSKAKLQPNRVLKNVVQLAGGLRRQSPKETPASSCCPPPPPPPPSSSKDEEEDFFCLVHRKPRRLFCHKDRVRICASCRGAQEHRGHKILPMEKAVQEEKHRIQNRLELLKKQKGMIERSKEAAKKMVQVMQDEGLEKKTVVAEIEEFCQFLRNQVMFLLLCHLEKLQSDITKKEKEISGQVAGQINQLRDLICDIEKTCEQPGGKLLKEIARLDGLISQGEELCSEMKRKDFLEYETVYNYCDGTERYLENSLGELENRFDQFVFINESVREMLPRFKAEMENTLKDTKNEVLRPYEKVCVTLDCDTANKFLVLSEDERSATFDMEAKITVPSHPRRFDKVPCVLGREEISTGRFYWDVDVEKGKTWAVGVARESVDRKSWVNFAPENGIWAVGFDERYVAYTGSESTPLSLSKPLKTIEVYLDYTAGEVSFYNADNHTLIFTFPPTKFSGGKIYPWFWISDGCLRLCWTDEDAYPDMNYFVSTGIIKPWEVDEYKFWG